MESLIKNPRGSVWHRWDPHIHAPGTILNNQFKGANPWGEFLARIDKAEPTIKALGITDYFGVDVYEKALEYKSKGSLPNVELLFPNVELRLGVETAKGSPINVHLLVSPDGSDHITEIRRFLHRITFDVDEETYHCCNADLIKLGKAHDRTVTDDRRALEIGANQFKVNFEQLQKLIKNSEWAQKNILIAISGNGGDGTSGLSQDASFAALRTELERCSHIIFSSHEKQREFWLGRGAASKEVLEEKWGGCKPCLNGSDAHKNEDVGKPALERYTWIKGDLTFESLRQACIEPEARASIGMTPPGGGPSSNIIESVVVSDSPWLETPSLNLNSGLVAVIGARGSGKTALADLIALGGYSLLSHLNERSFISRAQSLFNNEAVTLNWGIGDPTANKLKIDNIEDIIDSPRVQYLSQQFVEELCSAEGLTDKLLGEIERVIYQTHKLEDRMGAASFSELLDIRSYKARKLRFHYEESLAKTSTALIAEREKKDSLPLLEKQHADKSVMIENDKKSRQALLSKGQEERAKRHTQISEALGKVRLKLEKATRRHLALVNLQGQMKALQTSDLPNYLQQLKTEHAEAALTVEQWDNFKLMFIGDVDGVLRQEIDTAKALINSIKGPSIAVPEIPQAEPLIADDAVLEEQTFGLLSAELSRLEGVIGIDKENTRKYKQISEKITAEEAVFGQLGRAIEVAKKADARIKELIEERRALYKKVFEAILEEEKELTELYKPLMHHLQTQGGIVAKLSFEVRRNADVKAWAKTGESLLDLRKAVPFKGQGTLLKAIETSLQKAWETGDADQVTQAMAGFREQYESALLEHAQAEKSNKAAFRIWANKIAEWLYSTGHLSIKYGIQYDGLDIKQLSPGTRGIVLLLLYLAIDHEDDRPLIIDQPEENLDPKSIFDELVPRFRTARTRRQIIIITHNANLVVNTDVDQVIVATCGAHRPNRLPQISYASGGLENPAIRQQVCEILEGGEAAFKERAKRLRVRL